MRQPGGPRHARASGSGLLYTAEQRARRDASVWTLVQGVLAPLQFLVFAVSLVLVLRTLMTGDGYLAATLSILVKTAFLYTIMVTGAIWEKEVFGQYLLAPAFFWEDVVSFGVIALHTLYLYALLAADWGASAEMWIALAAYAAYVVNAAQFLWKLRQARLSAPMGNATATDRADRGAEGGAEGGTEGGAVDRTQGDIASTNGALA